MKQHPEAYLFVHCGDSEFTEEQMKDFFYVRGNHDYYPENTIPDQRILQVGKHRIYVCHGHLDILIYYHYDLMARHAQEYGCDTVFFGHMHICQDMTVNGVRMLNPDSVSYARDGTPKSYMLVSISEDGVSAERINYVTTRKHNKGLMERL